MLLRGLTYPALQSGAGGGLHNIWRVHSHVETQHQGYTHGLHLEKKTYINNVKFPDMSISAKLRHFYLGLSQGGERGRGGVVFE